MLYKKVQTVCKWGFISVQNEELTQALTLSAPGLRLIYTVSQKSDTDVAHYNFNAHPLILVTLCRNVAKRVCYQMVICYPTSPH